MTTAEIREVFLSYFETKHHRRVVSSPVIPWDDPTLLFTNAGMNQFKDVFLGNEKREYRRATTCQKCIRAGGKHNDLEEVGYTTRHATFLEMLGNFSFGDYFKEGAAGFAWELLTEGYGLNPDDLWITVYKDDDEAFGIWNEKVGVPSHKIERFGNIEEGDEENFWSMGDTGPCGPCSELFIDLGPERGCGKPSCGLDCDCGRYLELWNLVFMQFNRSSDGTLTPLPAPSIDTGMGLERLAMVMQNKTNIFRTDILGGIIRQIEEITGRNYEEESGMAFRVIADHIRSLSFAIADGALPSNEGRGYVLRRILRRAARYGRELDMHEPFLWRLVSELVDRMGEGYPELVDQAEHITLVIKGEEERFDKTIDQGIDLFLKVADKVDVEDEVNVIGDDLSIKVSDEVRIEDKAKVISGSDAFRLYDTYGFPLDLTIVMARERGLTVDTEGFEHEMESQRERARQASIFASLEERFEEKMMITGVGESWNFVGYDHDEVESRILAFRFGEQDRNLCDMVFESTPFYAESGGQVHDKGIVRDESGLWEAEVEMVVDAKPGRVHECHLKKGSFPESFTGKERIILSIDTESRRATEKNHTVTHLLHTALREILGQHVRQSGSFVGPDYFRFDFNHYSALSEGEISQVEEIVNRNILANRPVKIQFGTMEEATKKGAIAIFEEKYGEKVRMVEIEGVSLELCGGTHVRATGEIGLFQIYSESSAAAGIRRIEARTGMEAYRYDSEVRKNIRYLASLVGSHTDQLADRIGWMKERIRELERELKKVRSAGEKDILGELIRNAAMVDDVRVVAGIVGESTGAEIRNMGDILRNRLGSGVGVLGARSDSKGLLLCVVTDDLIDKRGLKAGEIVKRVAARVGGSGGGKPHMAMAGCRNPEDLKNALNSVESVIEDFLK